MTVISLKMDMTYEKTFKKIELDNRTGIKGNELISCGKDDLEGEELRNEILCDESRM